MITNTAHGRATKHSYFGARPVKHRMKGRPEAVRLALTLLSTAGFAPPVFLFATLSAGSLPAYANGGDGGSGFADGTGGTDSLVGTGGSGAAFVGSGGGAGAIGGDGGSGGGVPGGIGGQTAGSAGKDGVPGPDDNGSGGGGGAHGVVTTGASPLGSSTGGNGGNGGYGNSTTGAGGGGGAGGYGAVVTGPGAVSSAGVITGGNGGVGSNASNRGGGGGSGGTGVAFSASGVTFSNAGSVTGGDGGTIRSRFSRPPGAGGAGIVGADLSVINSGTITGGLGGDGVTRANAITFTGGTNSLELRSAPSGITGTVLAVSGGSDVLRLGGTGSQTFDASTIGAQFQNFGTAEKVGSGSWTLSNSTSAATPWTITAGTLAVGMDASLGTGSTVTFNGGTLQATADLGLARAVALTAAGGTIDSNGFNLTLGSAITGAGSLTKVGSGTLTLTGSNSYAGGTTVTDSSTLAITNGSALGTGSVTLGDGSTLLSTTTMTLANKLVVPGGNAGTLAAAAGTTLTFTGNLSLNFDLGSTSTLMFGSATNTGTVVWNVGGTSIGAPYNIEIAGGTVQAASNRFGSLTTSAAGFSPTTTIDSGARLELGDFNTTVAILQGGGTISTGNSSSTMLTLRAGTFDGVIEGAARVSKATSGTMVLNGANTYSGGTTVSAGTLQLGTGASLASGGNLAVNGGTFDLNGNSQTVGDLSGSGGSILLNGGALTAGTATANTTLTAKLTGPGSFIKQGSGQITLNAANTNTATLVNAGTLLLGTNGSLASTSTLQMSGGTFDLNGKSQTLASLAGSAGTVSLGSGTLTAGDGSSTSFAGVISDTGSVTKQGSGTLTLSGVNTYTGGTSVGGGILQLGIDSGAAGSIKGAVSTDAVGGALEIVNSDTSGITSITNTLGITRFRNATTAGGMTILNPDGGTEFHNTASAGTANITNSGTGFLTFFDNSTASHATITNGFSLVFLGSSTAGNATIGTLSGGTTTFIGSASGGHAAFTTAAGGTFDISGLSGGTPGMTAGSIAGAGSWVLGDKKLTVGLLNTDTTVSGVISGGGGSLVKVGTGTLKLGGANTYTGATEVAAGGLFLTGSLTSNVTVDAGANFGGTGTITGNLTVNGNIRPDTGTTNVVGIYTQGAGSTYTVEVTPGGQSDKINVTGNAVIGNTASVAVAADPGGYQRQTKYTILTASAGVTGTYSGVTSNFAFLTPTLSYDANDVFLTLLQTSSAFAAGGTTPNQKSVGHALDLANPTATGDFNTVLNALSLLTTQQAPGALDAISGVNYAGFGTLGVQSASAFMNVFGQQAGHGSGGSGRVALAASSQDACDFSCEIDPRWGAWMGGFGGLGTVAGDANSHSATYNLGGAAVGLDYKFDPQFTAGLTLGYSTSTLWTSGLPGQGTGDQVQIGLYGQFTQGNLYVDGLAGYAHGQNRMTRPIAIPGLAARVALGNNSVEQFFGLVETGYKVDVGTAANAFITPFARLQGSTASQAAFTESGADSLDLNVQQQTTNSLRTVLGAQVGATLAKVNVKLQAGWSHELADTGRPVTASFAGAPAFAFTTQGAAAPRDGAVLGVAAGAQIADQTSLFARYDGSFEGGTTSHSFSAGLRMTW